MPGELGRGLEVPDLKNGGTEATKRTKKNPLIFFSVSSVFSGAPFLRSGTFVASRAVPDRTLPSLELPR
jgi:hypothetical protein